MSTYTPIASVTLSAATSSVTFSGIPQTYTDLVLVSNLAITNANTANVVYRFNSDTGTNYSDTRIQGNGTTASSNRSPNATFTYANAIAYPSGTIGENIYITNILNYSNTTTYKTQLSRGNRAATGTDAIVGLWRSTAAITSVTILLDPNDSYKSGSTFNLYGVANASITNVAKATGGDSVYTDGTYWYHIFRSSGTFTPTQALTADYLVVAGGGGGYVQGGGAGGMRCTVTATGGGGSLESAVALTNATAYTVTVGAGGVQGNSGTTGSNSSIAGTGLTTITSTGGGGTSAGGLNGMNGGSGGGAFNSGTAGTGTANQGYTGGAAPTGNAGGGGGGAGAVGTAASGSTGGNGGNGVATSISGTSTTYAGGGAGYGTGSSGTAGTGGGGTAGSASPTSDGGANLGGGGGGNNAGNGGKGGSGIVIVRYSAA